MRPFDETLAAFEQVAAETRVLADEVAGVTVPDPYTELWPAAVTSSESMAVAGVAMVEGLRASDDGSARRQAVADYETAGAAFLAALDAVKQVTPLRHCSRARADPKGPALTRDVGAEL